MSVSVDRSDRQTPGVPASDHEIRAARRLRDRRERLGISREQLAQQAGVSVSTIKLWESKGPGAREIKRPTQSKLDKIMDALNRLEDEAAVRVEGRGSRPATSEARPDPWTGAATALMESLPPDRRREAFDLLAELVGKIQEEFRDGAP